MGWKRLLAYITGSIDQELLLRNEYLVTENRLRRKQIPGCVRLSDGERKTLAEIGKKLGKQALAEVATIVTPDTILAWHRKLIAQKFDGSKHRKAPGRPKVEKELEELVVHMAQENRSWGYDRIAGALHHLATPSVTGPSAISSNAMVSLRLPSGRRPQRGRHLSARIWTCWWRRTSLPPRSGRWLGW